MKLQATFEELNNLICQKTPVKGLSLSYCAADTLTVSFVVHILGLLSPTVSAKVKICSIEGSRVIAEVDAGSVGSWILDKAKKLLMEKTPEGLIESFESRQVVLNLGAIPELKAVFDGIVVNSLSFTEDAVCIDATTLYSRC